MITLRTAHYDAGGTLIRASEAYPVEDPADPQTVADLCAGAADAGCTYRAGTFLVWVDLEVRPHERIESTPRADGTRAYGGSHPPVPSYRWQRQNHSVRLVATDA